MGEMVLDECGKGVQSVQVDGPNQSGVSQSDSSFEVAGSASLIEIPVLMGRIFNGEAADGGL